MTFLYSRKIITVLLVTGICAAFVACNSYKFYQNKDYSFYQPDFRLSDTSMLRTDGVYVLQEIWTSQRDTKRTVTAKEREIYKFYPAGQVNMVLDPEDTTSRKGTYAAAFNNSIADQIAKKSRTLFQSYYKTEGDRLVVQRMNTPLAQFNYTYFTVKKDTLIQVSSTIDGGGQIRDKYYTDYYKAYYIFVPVKDTFTPPNW
ncbi:hypothetical protein ACFU8T_04685 [Sphingobacterium spiritivorum]|uniref:Uncharacterized protein n=1 Tax=Sphingobacterium spiritivorum ATCC 33861 TaxID=525373 RepID=D7VQI5_SPHSI|nr:hypothetical protein [Sphingobacterium spiritivorum]EFK56036.1 hypothetical protein HMPREF0766_13239 [Sphingobacterium spiritivorum ATCC 33861]WQD32560.1 hypothetical protein U0038_13665 [Sphingobacterium spiritivorum]SUJ11075.1 Uncharacterised protein [Sphingobacterium spiritivorum]